MYEEIEHDDTGQTRRTELSALVTLAKQIAGRRNNRIDDNFIVPTVQCVSVKDVSVEELELIAQTGQGQGQETLINGN
jgi:hypothetical protein